MADEGDWPGRREWYLKWCDASDSGVRLIRRWRQQLTWRWRRVLITFIVPRARWLRAAWRARRGAITFIPLAILFAALAVWWSWAYLTAFGSWLLKYSEEVRNLTLAVGVGAAIFGGWVAYQRSRTDRMRAKTDRLRQVTDSFGKAVELLGHEDRSVRLGAIYALERIARQNRDEHWPVMETLTAYVREWSDRTKREAEAGGGHETGENQEPSRAGEPEPAPADIQAVFTVLGLRRVDHEREPGGLSRRQLNLTGAYLVRARPDPPPAREFDGASLAGANLYGAELSEARLDGANLERTNLERANLWGANLDGARATDANLKGADVGMAVLPYGLTQEQLNSANGDRYTTIHGDDVTMPVHWDPDNLPEPHWRATPSDNGGCG